MALKILRQSLTENDAIALRQAVAGRFIQKRDHLSPLVLSLIDSFAPETLLELVNTNVELSNQIFNIDLRGSAYGEGEKLLMRFDELDDLPLPPYAIDRYPIYEKGVNLLYGLPGVGKSFIALDFIGHLAQKHPDQAIVYVAPEGWSSIPVRWKAWCKHYGVKPLNPFVMRQSLRMTNPDAVNIFKDSCAAIGMKVQFIVFDTLARALTGDNENDTKEMNLFIDAVERLRADLDCGILLVHHVNKQGMLRGSTVIEGAIDSMIKAQKDESQLVLFNAGDKGGKNRHREEAQPIYLNFVQVDVESDGVTDTAVVVELGDKVIQTPSKDTLTGRQREMLEALDGFEHGMTVKQLQEATNIPKPTIYRYAKLLQSASYLVHDREKDKLVITNAGSSAYRG